MENKYFISAYIEAAKNPMFQHRWMPAETWAELVNHYYKPPINLLLDSKQLLTAIARSKWFQTALETTGLVDEDLSIYKSRYRPFGGKQIYCFYSAPSGAKPTATEKNWFNYINYAEDLLIKTRVTRTNTLQLTTNIPEKADNPTRKRKKPQTQENNESEWIASKPLEENKV